MFELTDGAPEALSTVEMPANWSTEQHTEPMAAPRLRSLFECLGEVPEYRHARGKRYALNTLLTLAVAARLAGYRGVNAFAQFAALLSQEQLKAVGAFWSPSKQRYTPPAITTFHNVLAALPPETLSRRLTEGGGGAEGSRTPDLRIANATLSQLSYGPDTAAGDPRAGRNAAGSCGGTPTLSSEGRRTTRAVTLARAPG